MEKPEKPAEETTRREREYWLVERDMDACSLCEVCTRCCPTGALAPEEEGDTLTILFRPELCDGCGKCLEHCPEDASRIVRVDSLPETKVLARSPMLRCVECNAAFAPASKLKAAARRAGARVKLEEEHCPLCRRAQIVVRFIEEKRRVAEGKAEYRTGKKHPRRPAPGSRPPGADPVVDP